MDSTRDSVIHQDILDHAKEIHWGWEDMIHIIAEINDDVIDKNLWIAECKNGLVRISNILRCLNQYLPDRRYLFPGCE